MDIIDNFIKIKQVELAPNTHIIMSFGTFLKDDRILNCQLDETTIKNFLKNITTKKIKHRSVNNRIYKEDNMEYVIKNDGEENITRECLAVENVTLDTLGVRLKLILTNQIGLEKFPCKLHYRDIYNSSTIIIEYNNILEIHIITEERETITNLKLEVQILRQNIYEDKLINSLHEIIALVKENLIY